MSSQLDLEAVMTANQTIPGTTTDVGLDFGMLNNRLQFNGDYYIRKTTDMYTVGETLPDVFGASSPKGNYADMTTKEIGRASCRERV